MDVASRNSRTPTLGLVHDRERDIPRPPPYHLPPTGTRAHETVVWRGEQSTRTLGLIRDRERDPTTHTRQSSGAVHSLQLRPTLGLIRDRERDPTTHLSTYRHAVHTVVWPWRGAWCTVVWPYQRSRRAAGGRPGA